MSTDEQPIPGPDQMKPQRRFEETGSADEAPTSDAPPPKHPVSGGRTFPPIPPPPD